VSQETDPLEVTTTEKTWEDERAEFTQRMSELESRLSHEKVSSAFYRKAIAAGITDPDKLVGLVNLSDVTLGDDGEPQGIDEIISTITTVTRPKQPKVIGGPSDYSPAPQKAAEQLLKEAAEKARRTGRPEDVAAYSALKHKLTN